MSFNSNFYTVVDEQDRSSVTEWLNNAAISQNASEKTELLNKVQEIVLHKSPHLLGNYVDDFLSFMSDRSTDVKKVVVGFIEESCKQDEKLIPKVIVNLHMLLCDESVQIQKRVIQASSSIYKSMMIWLSKVQVVDEEMEQTWNNLNQIKMEIINMIDSDNDGVRTHSIKFLEGVILLQTYPEANMLRKENDFSLEDLPLTLKIARRRKLEEEANHIFSLLVKFHGSPHISSINLMACMGALCNIAKLRPEFMARVITALEGLQANLPPTLSHSQVSSVRKHLKLQLLNLIKHPSCGSDIKPSIATLLMDLGCSNQELQKLMPREEIVKKRSLPQPKIQTIKKMKLTNIVEIQEDSKKQQTTEINRRFIMDKLNLETITQLVISSIKNLPAIMPSRFAFEFARACNGEAITLAGISRILAEQFTEAGIGPGVREEHEPREKVEEEEKPQMVPPPSKVIVQHKPLRLTEVTRPLGVELRERMLVDAVQRVLKKERNGAAHARHKIITTLASNWGPAVRETVLCHLLIDMRSNVDLALAWLYEEYSLMQGFGRSVILPRRPEAGSYDNLLCALVNGVAFSSSGDRERDGLLARLYLEAPMVTDQALSLLATMCKRPERCVAALNLLHDLVIRRPPRGTSVLNVLLAHCAHENQIVRDEAVARAISIFQRPEWQHLIQQHALQLLNTLGQARPPIQPIGLLYGGNTGRPELEESPVAWDDGLIRACLSLYLEMLPIDERLIHELSDVYIQTGADVKRIILRQLERPIRGMGPDSPELLLLVEQCAKGSETLVTRILHILSDRTTPSPHLVSRVRQLYQSKVPDIRFLIPVLTGLTKKEITSALPKLIKLNPVVVKEVFNRLLLPDSPISPSELLIALHVIDSSKADVKTLMKATSLCFAERQVYTQETLAVVMQQLMEVSPLPTLLMRTVIQSMGLYPRLTGFVMNILQRLIVKQVWRQKVVWEGFVKCCQRTKPQSFHVLLQLPAPQLADALNLCADMRQPLLEHVHSLTDAQRAHIPSSTIDVLTNPDPVVPPVSEDLTINSNTEIGPESDPPPPGME